LLRCSVGLSIVVRSARSAGLNELGVANEELEVEFDGQLNIGVNPRFLLAVLAHLDNEKAEIRLSDPGSAILFTDTDALFAVMPMRA
jgi:DNA polymerase III sliding clamp (beta) subunit (PCNA family)